MRSFIALFGLATSVHALESSYSQCTGSSVHHATVLSTRAYTATFTSVPTNIISAPGQLAGSSSLNSAPVTQAYTLPSSGVTTSIDYETGTTNFPLATSTSSVTSISNAPHVAASSSHAQPSISIALGANDGPSKNDSPSVSHSSTMPMGTSSTSQWSTPSPQITSTTMTTSTVAPSGNSSSPKSSMVAFTGTSSRTLCSSGTTIVGIIFTMLLL